MTAKCKSLEVQVNRVLVISKINVISNCNVLVFSINLQTERDSLKLQCQTLQAEFEKNNETQVRIRTCCG